MLKDLVEAGTPEDSAEALRAVLTSLKGEQIKHAFCHDRDELILVMESGHLVAIATDDVRVGSFVLRVADPTQAKAILCTVRERITHMLDSVPEAP